MYQKANCVPKKSWDPVIPLPGQKKKWNRIWSYELHCEFRTVGIFRVWVLMLSLTGRERCAGRCGEPFFHYIFLPKSLWNVPFTYAANDRFYFYIWVHVYIPNTDYHEEHIARFFLIWDLCTVYPLASCSISAPWKAEQALLWQAKRGTAMWAQAGKWNCFQYQFWRQLTVRTQTSHFTVCCLRYLTLVLS